MLPLLLLVLPAGTIIVDKPIFVAAGTTLEGAKKGTVLKAGPAFRGKAMVIAGAGSTVERLTMVGNRSSGDVSLPMVSAGRPFADFYTRNAVLIDKADGVTLRDLQIREVHGFAVLARTAKQLRIERVTVEDSGSLNAKGRNNTTGGILLEEGSTDFTVESCTLRRVRGNGIWTHSYHRSPRNARGTIHNNRFEEIGRDAIQVGHATAIDVARNEGSRIGFPTDIVDVENGGIPVAIDTAGNVDATVYQDNRFEEINGKCLDLDGFHNGQVVRNRCVNKLEAKAYPNGQFGIVFNNTNPGMQSQNILVEENTVDGMNMGAIFIIGSGHTIRRNRFLRVNQARRTEPELLRSGIYLGAGAARKDVAMRNLVEENAVQGFGMKAHCVTAAKGVRLADQVIRKNKCE